MLDQRLAEADASKLDELRVILTQQEHAEKLCDIGMKQIMIQHGAAGKLPDAIRSLARGSRILLVTDGTEIKDIRGGRVKEDIKALLDGSFETEWLVIDEPEGIVHATLEHAEKIQARFEGVSCVVGVGSGTLCDLCKYAVYYREEASDLPLVIVQTALSVNAFSDDASVMLINGVKRTVHSRYPDILVIDLDIVTAAPPEMNVSGYGDLVATWTAPVDWYLSHCVGMSGNFHTAPSDMIRTQCKRLLENSERLKAGDAKVIGELANTLTLSGLSMGLAGESSPASGSEHVMSHLIDMSAGVRHSEICYHGTQVAVSGIISSLMWDYLLREFDPKAIDLERCYPTEQEMEPKVRTAFDWLDSTHNAADECWSDYKKKLAKWRGCRERFQRFLERFDQFKQTASGWVIDPAFLSECMHKAGAPCRYSALNYPVDAKTVRWAITNCHLMRNRFSIIDLLHFTGIWTDDFVQMLLDRAEALDAGI